MREPASVERLREFFVYDPETGLVRWRVKRCNRTPAGAIAGSPKSGGYIQIEFERKQYTAHRIGWALTHGEWPALHIDHINGDTADNRLENLRLATGTENNANMRRRPDNKTGYKGVTWYEPGKHYRAYIRKHDHLYYLGHFDDPQKAHAAYVAAANRMFGEFARPN